MSVHVLLAMALGDAVGAGKLPVKPTDQIPKRQRPKHRSRRRRSLVALDLDSGTVTVDANRVHAGPGEAIEGTTKTDSVRTLDLDQRTVGALKALADDDGYDPVCSLDGRGSDRGARMSLRSVSGDVTGHYLLRLTGGAHDGSPTNDESDHGIPTGADELPPPRPAREQPEVGGPLAPVTVASENDNEEYVVVEGTELLAQYGVGSISGGFSVMLRVRPDADLSSVVDTYVEQADQWEDAAVPEETPPPEVVEHDGTTVSTYHPPAALAATPGRSPLLIAPMGTTTSSTPSPTTSRGSSARNSRAFLPNSY